MKLRLGKYKGREVTVHQGANDWIIVDVVGGPQHLVVSPTNIELSVGEWVELHQKVHRSFFHEWLYGEESGRIERR